DMISTGTDIKPIECLLFMRDIRSPVYFEQMKGRGTRTISATDLKAVTPDGQHKTHFVIVDAVGVCESDKTDSRPLERKKSVPFDKLLLEVALGNRDEDTLTTLAGRLARLEAEIDDPARREIAAVAGGQTLPDMINRLLDAVDPDKQIARAREIFQTDEPGGEQIQQATAALINEACAPIEDPAVRDKLIEIKQRREQTIDTVSQDLVIFAGYDAQARDKAQGVIASFKKFMDENKDELTALQIFYSLPYGRRHLTFAQVEELAAAIKKPPYSLTPELIWKAYERLEEARVRGAGPKKLLTDLISLVRFTLGESDTLEPYGETVNRRFESWLAAQKLQGRDFTLEQLEWLRMIKEHVATSLTVEVEDFELAPFFEKGGPVKAFQLFGPDLPKVLTEVNEALAA
ncbi:MAG: restriction endonuclease subunit R, partial [Proteobacteria bacterium]|nr:restriction endonuclease subunit R [Pseudomonadota bacterium]